MFEALGAEASYDPSAKLLALGNLPVNPPSIKPAPGTGDSFTVVINGVIIKTTCQKSGDSVFIPVNIIQAILEACGNRFSMDGSSNIAAVSTGSPVKVPSPEKPAATETPVSPTNQSLLKGKEKKEAVIAYMNALKRVLDAGKPGEAEKKKLSSLEPGKDAPSGDDMNAIIDKQRKMLAEIKKLNPPEEETREIHNLAVSISSKMIRVMEIATKLIAMPGDRANPKAEEEMATLLKQLTEEEKEFNEKVQKVRRECGMNEKS